MHQISITTAAASPRVSTATLRYEDEGLLRPAGRTEASYRVYGEDALQRVGFIQRAKALGLTLCEIHPLTNAPAEASVDRTR